MSSVGYNKKSSTEMCCFFCLFIQWNILYILHSEKLNRYYTGALLPAGYADYYPVGEKLPTRNSTVGYRSGFQGQEFDAETNMEAFRLRLRDGRIGRWMSRIQTGNIFLLILAWEIILYQELIRMED